MLGLQHYLTMFGSTVSIPLILSVPLGIAGDPEKLATLIGTMFFVSGITTLIQTNLGNRLPIVQGGTFSFLAPTFAICGAVAAQQGGFEVRMQTVQGAIIVGSFFEMLIGMTGLAGKLLRFIGPLTIAPTIALIGLALFPYGAPVAGKDWLISGLTIGTIVLFSLFLGRRHRIFALFPILLGIGLVWALCSVLSATGVYGPGDPGFTSLTFVEASPWLRVPTPFQWALPGESFGWPQFSLAAIVGMLAGYVASIVESIGDYFSCARLSGAPVPDARIINRGIAAEGLGCLVAGIFGTGNGTTSYSENIGAIGLTGVGSRRVVQMGALLMLGLGMVAKFGALFTTIPEPIKGGMYCSLFGIIAAVGLSNLQFVDLNSPRNLFILGFAFFMGLSLPAYIQGGTWIDAGAVPGGPFVQGMAVEWVQDFWNQRHVLGHPLELDPPWLGQVLTTLAKTSMAVGALTAAVLDNLIPGTDHERGLTAWVKRA